VLHFVLNLNEFGFVDITWTKFLISFIIALMLVLLGCDFQEHPFCYFSLVNHQIMT
jgi:hypothetical protein